MRIFDFKDIKKEDKKVRYNLFSVMGLDYKCCGIPASREGERVFCKKIYKEVNCSLIYAENSEITETWEGVFIRDIQYPVEVFPINHHSMVFGGVEFIQNGERSFESKCGRIYLAAYPNPVMRINGVDHDVFFCDGKSEGGMYWNYLHLTKNFRVFAKDTNTPLPFVLKEQPGLYQECSKMLELKLGEIDRYEDYPFVVSYERIAGFDEETGEEYDYISVTPEFNI